MRLTDGLVYENEWGMVIRLEKNNFAINQIVSWVFCMTMNDSQEIINEVVTLKINRMEKELEKLNEKV